jgi:hypothetical protein
MKNLSIFQFYTLLISSIAIFVRILFRFLTSISSVEGSLSRILELNIFAIISVGLRYRIS